MNGNDYADILKYSGGEWRAQERLPEEWWKTDFPYGKALKMGYQLSPEEVRKRMRSTSGTEKKTLSERLADILQSEDFKMLTPDKRVKVLADAQKLQAAIAEGKEKTGETGKAQALMRERPELRVPLEERKFWWEKEEARKESKFEREKWEVEQLKEKEAIEREMYAASEEKATAYREKIAAQEEARKLRNAAIYAKRRDDLAEATRLETEAAEKEEAARRLRISEIDAEGRRLTAEKKAEEIERRDFKYKKATETREFEAKEAEKLQEQLNWEEEKRIAKDEWTEEKRQWGKEFGADEATRMFDEKMRGLEYEKDVKDTDKQYELDVEKLGEEKAENIRQYNLDTIAEKHSWSESLYQRGFKNKEFMETSKEFWGTLDFNKEKEKIRATEFGMTYELDTAEEANTMKRFKETLEKEYADLNLDIKKFGLDEEKEQRIAEMAMFNFALDTKQFGLDQAIQRFEEAEANKKWYWKGEYFKIDDMKARTSYINTMARIVNDAKETDLKTAIYRESIRQFDENTKLEWKKLEKEEGVEIKLSEELSTTLSDMSPDIQNEVTGCIKTTYDVKKGTNWFPKEKQMIELGGFLFGRGEGETRTKERLGINLSNDEFIRAVLSEYTWSDEMKGWIIRNRDNERCWRGMRATGAQLGVLISPDIEEKTKTGWFESGLGKTVRKIGETVKGWWPFGEKETPATETTPTTTNFAEIKAQADVIYSKNNSMAEVEEYLDSQGMTLDEYRNQLRAGQ